MQGKKTENRLNRGTLKDIWFLMRLFNAKEMITIAAFELINVFLPMALLYCTQRLVDATVGANTLYALLAVTASIILTILLFRYGHEIYLTKLKQMIGLRMEERLAERIPKIRMDAFESANTGDAVANVWNHSAELTQVYVYVLDGIMAIAQIIGIALVIGQTSPLVACGIFLGFIPAVYLNQKYGFEKYFTEIGQVRDYRRNWYLTQMAFKQKSNQEMRFFGLFPHIAEKQAQLNLRLNRKMYDISRKHFLRQIPAYSIAAMIYVGALLYCILSVETVGYGLIAILFQAISQMNQSIFRLSEDMEGLIQKLQFGTHGMRLLFSIPEETVSDQDAPFETLDMEQVCFSYPNAEKDAVHNVSLHVRVGEKLVIVGENGSGKTTLLKLILGFYSPQAGEIRVNGRLEDGALAALRRQCSVLFQDYVRFNLSLYDNVDMGRGYTRDEVRRALNQVGLGEWSDQVGMDTILGEAGGGGANASGGQWQRIAIARALVSGSKLLLMDEPIASLDPAMENDMYEMLTKLPDDMTVLCISHRLGMTRGMDRILVMQGGVVAEEGAHDFLMKQGGVYAKMYETQAGVFE